MKVLNRHVQLATLPARAMDFGKAVISIFFTFNQPLFVLTHYLRSSLPNQGYVDLRNGYRITFSAHKHDLISTIIVFCKQDYGSVKAGDICLDIGANIGLFAIYAVSRGASLALAFEANEQAYDTMVKNVQDNDLDIKIQTYHLAVTDQSNQQVAFPISASPYNKISGEINESSKFVQTIDLNDILDLTPRKHVDVLQMDIEGAEYKVFSAAEPDTLAAIDEIRMEYHPGPISELIALLGRSGFKVVKHKKEQKDSGIIWFSQTKQRVPKSS